MDQSGGNDGQRRRIPAREFRDREEAAGFRELDVEKIQGTEKSLTHDEDETTSGEYYNSDSNCSDSEDFPESKSYSQENKSYLSDDYSPIKQSYDLGHKKRFANGSAQKLDSIPSGWRTLFYRLSISVGIASFVVSFGVAASAFAYVLMYWHVMPDYLLLEVPVFFDFDPLNRGQGACFNTPVNYGGAYDCNFFNMRYQQCNTDSAEKFTSLNEGEKNPGAFLPRAVIELWHAHQQWTPETSLDGDAEAGDLRFSNAGQMSSGFMYDIWLELLTPDSNARTSTIGNFMVTLELLSKNKVIGFSKRPALVHSLVKDPSFSMPSAWLMRKTHAAGPSTVPINVGLFENYRERPDKKVDTIRLKISSPNVHLLQAQLKFICNLRGIAYYMYQYRLVCFVCFILASVFLQAVMVYSAVGIFGLVTAISLFSGEGGNTE